MTSSDTGSWSKQLSATATDDARPLPTTARWGLHLVTRRALDPPATARATENEGRHRLRVVDRFDEDRADRLRTAQLLETRATLAALCAARAAERATPAHDLELRRMLTLRLRAVRHDDHDAQRSSTRQLNERIRALAGGIAASMLAEVELRLELPLQRLSPASRRLARGVFDQAVHEILARDPAGAATACELHLVRVVEVIDRESRVSATPIPQTSQ